MSGRPHPTELVQGLAGSAHAKQRLTLFLQTLSGEKTVPQACAELGIGESRFFDQRSQWMADAVALLEPRSAGRPRKATEEGVSRELAVSRQRVRELESQSAALAVRERLQEVLLHVMHRPPAEKKGRLAMLASPARTRHRRHKRGDERS